MKEIGTDTFIDKNGLLGIKGKVYELVDLQILAGRAAEQVSQLSKHLNVADRKIIRNVPNFRAGLLEIDAPTRKVLAEITNTNSRLYKYIFAESFESSAAKKAVVGVLKRAVDIFR